MFVCMFCFFFVFLWRNKKNYPRITTKYSLVSPLDLNKNMSVAFTLILVLLNPDMSCLCKQCRSVSASVAQLDAPSDWRLGGRGFNPRQGRQHSFVEIDHEIFSTVILSLPLIQEGQLSVSGERMCTILVNRLED